MDNKDFPTQPDISDAIHQLITQTPGKYEGMAKTLDPKNGTDNALRNRVRQLAGQVVPLGMAVDMEFYSGRSDITEAMCKRAGGVFVKLPVIDEVGNEELLVKFNDLLGALGDFSRAHNEFTADGILDRNESKRLKAKGYRAQSLIAEIWVVTEMLLGEGDAPVCGTEASGALTKRVE
ncbi:TPA: DNA-binding protein [Yersinia enterocolitica]|uniref:YmfL family putative regulatory protein n=1 Tax=Yersinia enterocolitica TaxID=630 RepID=UPI0028BCC61B|nr:DNA-binding protein [Yersinia enterocolitica]ELI7912031.1 DNA-binding protein [Yersinia enterocolitica]ELI8129209.1 DNA-binding protein [Yersinia enterocolitica]HDL6612902.1 DNA-binding protein [Yersinia enterocolitica]HDL7364857.1 DNA-binding protein [Yersinia enterocolitica]